MKNPSNSLELCDGTMVTSDDSAEFYFENYNGDESNRLSFVGSTEKDYLIFQAEGPLAAELKQDFQGSDFPSCPDYDAPVSPRRQIFGCVSQRDLWWC